MTIDALTTQDFEHAGLPFEAFLRYAQLSPDKQAQATALFRRRWPTRTTITHVQITDPDGARTVFHTKRVDAPALLGELVELHEAVEWEE